MRSISPLHIAQLTDTHIFAEAKGKMLGVCTFQTLQSVVKQVASHVPKPDLLLLTGDLSQDETEASYRRLYEAIAPLGIPTYCIPGNHDQPALMEQVLNIAPFSTAKHIQAGGWDILLLSTAAAGCVHGVLSEQALDELEAQLLAANNFGQRDRPTLVVLHHPPVPIHSAWMDRIALQQPERFHSIIQQYPIVKGVLFGHIHQAFETTQQGVRFLGSPSTCVQFVPNSEAFAIDDQAAGFRWLTLYPDGSFTTEVKRAH